jgi:hypothetical protein
MNSTTVQFCLWLCGERTSGLRTRDPPAPLIRLLQERESTHCGHSDNVIAPKGNESPLKVTPPDEGK